MKWLIALLLGLAVLARLPAVVQPAGGDQGLYAYVGQAIARGELPYRDAWDQKPPAVHLTYGLMFAAWPDDRVVAAADFVLALLTAWLVFRLGRRFSPRTRAGEAAALLYLVLGNPAFGRLGGMWVRGQCEAFIAPLVCGALLLLAPTQEGVESGRLGPRPPTTGGAARTLVAGGLLGLAFLYKYNAAVYLLAAVATFAWWPAGERTASRVSSGTGRSRLCAAGLLIAGAAIPPALTVLAFWYRGALADFWQATVIYNLAYSGETYPGVAGAALYLLTFPIARARLDGLWFVGGLGSAVMLGAALAEPALAIVPLWVAAACLSIAVNGARDLPQYFVQALPLLALAGGLAATWAWQRLAGVGRLVVFGLVAVAVLRVAEFDTLAANIAYDLEHATGRVRRAEYLARFGGQRPTDKFSALAVAELGEYLAASTSPTDRVFVFGFSGGAYVRADRVSASRFFWSRPVLSGFADRLPGYGPSGLLNELQAARPSVVVLQRNDWPAEPIDSAGYFLKHPELEAWLEAGYARGQETAMYQIWTRR